MIQKNTFLLLYALIAGIYLIADANDWLYLRLASKPMLVSILLLYFLWATRTEASPFRKAMTFGLIFSIIGDSLLLFEGELFFLLGLCSFLGTHIVYSYAFLKRVGTKYTALFVSNKIALFCILLLLVSLMSFLWSSLGALRWPVLLYAIFISLMGLSAYHLKGRTSHKIFALIFTGALCFIFSDSMIAMNKFKSTQLNLPFPGLLVMIPYLIAQFLIVEGSIALNMAVEK